MARKKTTLHPKARKAAIFDFISRSGKVSVAELADQFETSVETVRRDLSALAVAGRVRKIHGGAVKISPPEEGPFEQRLAENTLAKQIIAEKLVQTISPGQSLMIDTGSSTLICAQAFSRVRELTVITNSARIAAVVSKGNSESKAILLGGSYRHDNAQTVGPKTIADISQYRVDRSILAIGTLDAKGACDFSEEEAQVARAMIAASERVTVVADRSKLNKRSTFHVCDLNQIDRLILDRAPDESLRCILNRENVEIC